jgi:mono/diheme cytochrome c family protein
MASAPLLTKLHVLLAFAFAAYFPFTKLIHAWTLPVNYLVRPYQVLRTAAKKFQNGWVLGHWEFKGVTDKSYMTYLAGGVIAILLVIGLAFPSPDGAGIVPPAQAKAIAAGQPAGAPMREVLDGYPLYVSQCARCHGLEGKGDGPGAKSPTFKAAPRDLTAGHFQFISTDNGVASDADLRQTLVHGLQGSGMPGFSALSEHQIRSLIDVVESIWRDRPEPGKTIAVPTRPPTTPALVAQGKELYANYCTTCHGAKGAGDGVLASLRTDAAGRKVPPHNLRVDPLKGGQSATQIYYRIAAGLPRDKGQWLMPSYPNLGPERTWAIIAYLEEEVLPRRLTADATATP